MGFIKLNNIQFHQFHEICKSVRTRLKLHCKKESKKLMLLRLNSMLTRN